MARRTLQQEADMRQLRTDHELEVESLLHEIERATIHGDIKGVVTAKQRLRASLRQLMDAAYGPCGAVQAIRYPRPECVICGATMRDVGIFCVDCLDECLEAKADPARRWRYCPDGSTRWLTDSEWKAAVK